tara:strand:+ start:481 stop:708 length:228 start_codon:yes stop_codon:yes gene_type:complete
MNCKCSKKISKEDRIGLVADNIKKIELVEDIQENINDAILLLEYFKDGAREVPTELMNLNITLLKQNIRDLNEIS